MNATRGFRLAQVRFGYDRGAVAALDCPNLTIEPGLVLVLGPNGAGKSTLLKLLAGVEMPDEGSITVDGYDLWREEVAARRCLAYLPEQPDITPYATVGEVLRLVATARGCALSEGERQLARVGLADCAGRTVRQLSMGQRRRVLLAAALVGEPANLVLDEPLETMDRPTRDLMIAWITARVAAGATVLVATHEIEPFLETASRALVVRAGEIHDVVLPSDLTERRRLCDHVARGDGG